MKRRSATPDSGTMPEKIKPLGRRERRGIETREKIFRTALDLFAERGFNATTIDAIADGADIGRGTFFNYFENKESILLQFREMQMGRVMDFVTASMKSDEPLVALIYQLVLTMTAEQRKSPALFLSFMAAISSNELIRARMAEGLGRAREMLAGFIEKRQQTGEIRSDLPAAIIAHSLQRMIMGTMLVWSLDPERPLEEHLKTMVNIFLKGIQTE